MKPLPQEMEQALDSLSKYHRAQFERICEDEQARKRPKGASRDMPDATTKSVAHLGLTERECRQWTFTGAARARVHGRESFETECHRALLQRGCESERSLDILIPRDVLEYRAMDSVPGSKGGFLVEGSSESYYDTLRNRSVSLRLGMQFVPDQVGNVTWPRRTSAATPAWLQPGVGITDSDPIFSQLTATPKTLMVITKSSLQLEQQMSPMLEAANRNSLANDQVAAMDGAVLNGAGGKEPLGILNAGIGSASGASADFPKVVKMQTDTHDANGATNYETMGYVASPLTAGLLKGRQRFTSTDSPIWAGGVGQGSIEGIPALSTKNMPANTLLFGDWSQALLIEWGAMALAIDRSTGFNLGQIGIRLLWRVDLCVLNLPSFTKLISIS